MKTLWDFFFSSLPAADSPFGTVNWKDLLKVLRVAAVAAVAFFLSQLAKDLSGLDFGSLDKAIDLLAVGITELSRRFLSDKK